MIQRATVADIWAYKDSPAISRSFLKEVVMAGKSTSTQDTDRGLGSIVDTCLTMPDHADDFFAAFKGNAPTPTLSKVLVNAMEHLLEKRRLTADITYHKDTVLRQTELDDFDQKKKPETRWASIVEKARDWWLFNVDQLGQGREVITAEDLSLGIRIADMAREHPVSRMFFTHLEGRDYYYQKAIYFEYLGVKCKALLDILIVSHVRRKLVITDIKTIFEATQEQIAFQIKKFQYPIQPSFYEVAAESILEELGAVGYEIETNFLFIPKNIRDGGIYFKPVIWPCTTAMKHWARYGGKIMGSRTYAMEEYPSQFGIQEVMGWEEGLMLYKDCMATGARTYRKKEKPISPYDADKLYFT